MMSLDKHKALSRRLYEEVFGRGNVAAADEILTDDSVSHGPGTPPTTGTAGIKAQAERLRTAIPDLLVTLNDQIAEGDRVVSRWTASGTFNGSFAMPTGSLAPTGGQVSFDEIRIDRFVGGRIMESWFIPDRLTLFHQCGLVPQPLPARR